MTVATTEGDEDNRMRKKCASGGSPRPLLIVHGGGKNPRIGNHLPMFCRLFSVAKASNRDLHFPFIEQSILKIFDSQVFRDLNLGIPGDYTNMLLNRMIRTAEEVVEGLEGTEPFQYSEAKLHSVRLEPFNMRILFGRGTIDFAEQLEKGEFKGDDILVIKDPYPFNPFSLGYDESLQILADRISFRAENLDVSAASKQKALDAEMQSSSTHYPILDICFHLRQGDFKRWNNGRFWYTPELLEALIRKLRGMVRDIGREAAITIVSDEGIPEDILSGNRLILHSKTMEYDFSRLAVADLVLSNSSTFSAAAAAAGRVYLKRRCAYISLGPADQALDTLARRVPELLAGAVQAQA